MDEATRKARRKLLAESAEMIQELGDPVHKFAAKFDHATRCAILACRKRGIPIKTLSNIFKADRRTIRLITDLDSGRYGAIHKEFNDLGPEEFTLKYYTEEIHDKIREYQGVKTEENKDSDPERPLKSASQKQGIHIIENLMCKRPHRVMIGWYEPPNSPDEAGWYVKDLEDKDPQWGRFSFKPHRTSGEALKAANESIADFD